MGCRVRCPDTLPSVLDSVQFDFVGSWSEIRGGGNSTDVAVCQRLEGRREELCAGRSGSVTSAGCSAFIAFGAMIVGFGFANPDNSAGSNLIQKA